MSEIVKKIVLYSTRMGSEAIPFGYPVSELKIGTILGRYGHAIVLRLLGFVRCTKGALKYAHIYHGTSTGPWYSTTVLV